MDVPVEIPADGEYRIEVVAWQRAAGDEHARLEVAIESDSEASRGALSIRRKLSELHEMLHGISVSPDSPDVDTSYELFLDVWNRKRLTEGDHFNRGQGECPISDDLYFEGVADVVEFDERGDSSINLDRYRELIADRFDLRDPSHIARTWVVVLAYLLTDYRYLHL